MPTATEQLQACINGVDKITNLINTNKGIAEFNDAQKLQYDTLFKKNGDDYTNAHNDWQNNKNTKYTDLKSELLSAQTCGFSDLECRPHSHDNWCTEHYGQGWYMSGKRENCGVSDLGCRANCSRTDDKVNQDLDNWVQNNQEPTLTSTPTAQHHEQNTSAVDLSCCSNIDNNIGSSLTNVTINQISDCKSSLQTRLSNASDIPVSTSDTPVSSPDTATTATKTKTIIIIIILFLLVLFSSSGLLLVVNKQ